MADAMDWTPTAPALRRNKRNHDSMMAENTQMLYGDRYVPGGWPRSPAGATRFADAPALPALHLPYINRAKRVCSGVATCFSYTTASINTMCNLFNRLPLPRVDVARPFVQTTISVHNILRRVRQAQLPRLNGRVRPRRAPSSRTPPRSAQHQIVSENIPPQPRAVDNSLLTQNDLLSTSMPMHASLMTGKRSMRQSRADDIRPARQHNTYRNASRYSTGGYPQQTQASISPPILFGPNYRSSAHRHEVVPEKVVPKTSARSTSVASSPQDHSESDLLRSPFEDLFTDSLMLDESTQTASSASAQLLAELEAAAAAVPEHMVVDAPHGVAPPRHPDLSSTRSIRRNIPEVMVSGVTQEVAATLYSDISSTKPDTAETASRLHLGQVQERATSPFSDISSTKPDTEKTSSRLSIGPVQDLATTPYSEISSTKPDTEEAASRLNISMVQETATPSHSNIPLTRPVVGATPELGVEAAAQEVAAALSPAISSTQPVAGSAPELWVPSASNQVVTAPYSSVQSTKPDIEKINALPESLIRKTARLALSKATHQSPLPEELVPTPKSSPHAVEMSRRSTRKLSLELKRQQQSKKFQIVPLTKEWETKVTAALKDGHGQYKAPDLLRVVPPPGSRGTADWLNDEVVNSYLDVICAHGNQDKRPEQTPKYHAFSSYFMKNLETGGPSKVSRWAKRAKIGGKKLLDLQKIFVPINSGAHWTLLVVAPQTKSVTYYNSMSGGGMKWKQPIFAWLRSELGKDFEANDWMFEARADSPQQTNMSDCGVFTITTAKQIMLGQDVMDYGPSDIPLQRKRVIAELINNGLIPSEKL